MGQPNLADPDFEPTDGQLAELMRRAFAGLGEEHRKRLTELHERIARDGEEARRHWISQHP